jgi:hypothetical protein
MAVTIGPRKGIRMFPIGRNLGANPRASRILTTTQPIPIMSIIVLVNMAAVAIKLAPRGC